MKMRRERNIQPRKRQDFSREDNNNKMITKIRNIELRAISIGPKPFLFFMFGVFSVEIKSCFPLKTGYFCSFLSVSLPFVLPFVLPTLSHFPFSLSLSLSLFLSSLSLSLSFSLSLSLSISLHFLLFSCFIPSLITFLFPCFFVFLSCLVSLLLFHAKQNIKILHLKGSSHQCLFCLVAFLFLFSLWNPLLSFSHGPSPCLVFLSLVFVGVFLFCVGFVFLPFFVGNVRTRESYPTSHLTARPLKIVFQKCLFLSTNFLIHKEGLLEVRSPNPIFAVFLLNFIHVFWEMLRQNW